MPEMQLHADWAVTMGCDDACPLRADDEPRPRHPVKLRPIPP